MSMEPRADKFCELLEAAYDDELQAPKDYAKLRFSLTSSLPEDERTLVQHLIYTIEKDETKHAETIRVLRNIYCGKP